MTSRKLEDLYLECRFALRVNSFARETQLEEVRTEGAAARWIEKRSVSISATTGTSGRAIQELLSPRIECNDVARVRPVPAPDIDAPRGWREWAKSLVTRLRTSRAEVLYLSRNAVIVNRSGWSVISSPPLVRVRTRSDEATSLLAVADHALLGKWINELIEKAPVRRWRPPSGHQVPVVLTNGTSGALIHELLGHLVEADIITSGDSPFGDSIGMVVAPRSIDLVDDPTRFDMPGAFDCDDEGVPAQKLTIVEQGRIQGFLCDRRLAEVVGCQPGRGRRASWNRPPVPRMSNLVIAPGKTDPEDLERDVRSGLVVTRIGGATVDPVTLRTVIKVERGYEIRHGRRRRALMPCELIGSALEILAGIEAELGNDHIMDWRLGWCVKGGWPLPTGSIGPTMLVHHLEVL